MSVSNPLNNSTITRQRSNTVPIQIVNYMKLYNKQNNHDESPVSTTPTNTPSTPIFTSMKSCSYSDKTYVRVGSISKSHKLFEFRLNE
jgi:hypothetical protein